MPIRAFISLLTLMQSFWENVTVITVLECVGLREPGHVSCSVFAAAMARRLARMRDAVAASARYFAEKEHAPGADTPNVELRAACAAAALATFPEMKAHLRRASSLAGDPVARAQALRQQAVHKFGTYL